MGCVALSTLTIFSARERHKTVPRYCAVAAAYEPNALPMPWMNALSTACGEA